MQNVPAAPTDQVLTNNYENCDNIQLQEEALLQAVSASQQDLPTSYTWAKAELETQFNTKINNYEKYSIVFNNKRLHTNENSLTHKQKIIDANSERQTISNQHVPGVTLSDMSLFLWCTIIYEPFGMSFGACGGGCLVSCCIYM